MSQETDFVLGLDDPAATEVARSGAKGAGLARARAAGFPVLDGFVISPDLSMPALDRAVDVLEQRGTGGARMSIIGHEVPLDVEAAIAAAGAALPAPLIVRSSSVLEGSGEWSGAFTSVPEVLPAEVSKATKSVWATCFSIEVLERFEEAELAPGSAPMGVLVQHEVHPDFGGAAIVDASGAVTVNAVKGSPRDLMAGWVPGVKAVLEDGILRGDDAVELMGSANVRAVADMALQVQSELGHNLIEWAIVDDSPILLQVQDSVVHEVEEAMVIPAALGHPWALDFIQLTHRYSHPMADELVLGWRASVPTDLQPIPFESGGDRETVLVEATRLARQLTAQAWNEAEDDAMAHAALVLRRMRSDRPNESIDALNDLTPVHLESAARLLGMYEHLVNSDNTPGRRGIGRWEPVMAGVLALQGEVHEAEPSVGGVGAGRLVWLDSSKLTGHVRPRDIIVTQYPLQNFSPLLWDAAGIITVGGAPTAHLFEVARSLTVPAVINCAIADIVKAGPRLGMLDGDAGRVALLPE
ncbi:MAG: PEP/pyruvate-binding domain-containing protein [Acidimicrobiales bacterium]